MRDVRKGYILIYPLTDISYVGCSQLRTTCWLMQLPGRTAGRAMSIPATARHCRWGLANLNAGSPQRVERRVAVARHRRPSTTPRVAGSIVAFPWFRGWAQGQSACVSRWTLLILPWRSAISALLFIAPSHPSRRRPSCYAAWQAISAAWHSFSDCSMVISALSKELSAFSTVTLALSS